MKRTLIAMAIIATSITAHAAPQTNPQRDIAEITAAQQIEQEAQKYVLKVYANLGYEPAVAAQFAASKEGKQIAYIMRDAIIFGRMNRGTPPEVLSPEMLDLHAKETMLRMPVVAQNIDDDAYMRAIYITWADAFFNAQKGQ